jgi:thiol-disulfide isomerase/thioredoxin
LEEGILFARDPVLKYQKSLENDKELIALATNMSSSSSPSVDDSSESSSFYKNYQLLPAPRNFGLTLDKLFQEKILYPTDRNENGSHANKGLFVKGCSFPDYAEVEIWPQDTTDGAAVRFGFPGIKELTLETRMDAMMSTFDKRSKTKNVGDDDDGSDTNGTSGLVKKKKQSNPFVVDIESLGDISSEIRNEERDAVLFVSAPYCRLCRSIGPLYNRMARISKEELNSDLLFAKATTGTSKAMKQLTFTLQIDSVPTFVLFRKGDRFGEPFGVTKLPSVKLDRAIECLKTGKEWDESIVDIQEGGNKLRTQI